MKETIVPLAARRRSIFPSAPQKDTIGSMDPKARLNHKLYIQILRRMSPESRLLKSFELTQFAKDLFIHGLRKRFPNLSEAEFKQLYPERIDKCHNRNY
jgi:hypothetical protein